MSDLKLNHGHCYIDRSGITVRVVARDKGAPNCNRYPFESINPFRTYTGEGRYYQDGNQSQFDLVSDFNSKPANPLLDLITDYRNNPAQNSADDRVMAGRLIDLIELKLREES